MGGFHVVPTDNIARRFPVEATPDGGPVAQERTFRFDMRTGDVQAL